MNDHTQQPRDRLPDQKPFGRLYGKQRTHMDCHACHKYFYAVIDYDLNGNHEIQCLCGHIHYRVIKQGVVTQERYMSDAGPTIVVKDRSLWQSDTVPVRTSTASQLIRDLWLNRES